MKQPFPVFSRSQFLRGGTLFAIAIAQDQINFAAAPPGRSIIALQQAQTRSLQMGKRLILGFIALLPGRQSCGGSVRRFPKEPH